MLGCGYRQSIFSFPELNNFIRLFINELGGSQRPETPNIIQYAKKYFNSAVFTDSAPRPSQSSSHNVRPYVLCSVLNVPHAIYFLFNEIKSVVYE